MGYDGLLGDLKSHTDRLKQALEKFDLTFLDGFFILSCPRSVRLVLVRRVESDRSITQAKWAQGSDLKDHGTHNAPFFSG